MSELARNAHVAIARDLETKEHLIVVTARTAEADSDWWDRAARGSIWSIEHIEENGLDLVRATRRVRNLANADRLADRTRRQINRSLDRFYAARAAAERARQLQDEDPAA